MIDCFKLFTRKLIIIFSLLIGLPIIALAQKDNINIIPLSPNIAEFSKYTEIPVSTFTGVPNIGFPIYTIKSSELEIPLGLQYHAGGNKVESIASWVGLSWSLSSLPTISRAVNGKPDEVGNGYFYKFQGKSIRNYLENYTGGYDQAVDQLMEYVVNDNVDTEPDIFNFQLLGKSGKFYYNQDIDKFICSPYSNLKIEYTGLSFKIIDDAGVQYLFEDKETTTVSSTSPGAPITSAWSISKIISASKLDTISFTYERENQLIQSLVADIQYYFTSNGSCNILPKNVSGGQLTSIAANRLRFINFRGGKLEFVREDKEREDLSGGYSLKMIKVLDQSNSIIKQYRFRYSYATGNSNSNAGCISSAPYRGNKWMFLDSFVEVADNNVDTLSHKFVYNKVIIPPCRISTAQDYWGYYNGKTSNSTLIPKANIPNSQLVVSGADRSVDPNYTQFGILNKIIYPSGGSSVFEYENNDSYDPSLPKSYTVEAPYLAHEKPISDDDPLPPYAEYETFFTINNPPDSYLNNSNPNGGAFVSGDIESLGVPPGSTGASIIIRRITPTAPIVQIVPSMSFQNHYLPNGRYSIKAAFNQDPPNYQNFQVILYFNKIDSTKVNSYLGGLRVKSVRLYHNNSVKPLITNFSYIKKLGSLASSGSSFLKPLFNYSYERPVGNGTCISTLLTLKSYSNQPQVSSFGSYVGYEKVFVTSDSADVTGITSFSYSTQKDQVFDDQWPFPPAQSMEAFRGQLLETSEYKKLGNNLKIVKRSNMSYINDLMDSPRMFGVKVSTEPFSSGGRAKGKAYEFALEWSAINNKIERLYDFIDTTKYNEIVTDFSYDDLFKQLVSTSIKQANEKTKIIRKFYPYNLLLSGDAEVARKWLLNNNSLSTILKEEILVGTQSVDTKMTSFKNFNGVDFVKEYESTTFSKDVNSTKKLIRDEYDQYGNIAQYHQDNGINYSILWGYGGKYPIIEVKNSNLSVVKSYLNASILMQLNNSNPRESFVDSVANILRTNLPLAQVQSFVYQPLVGVKSITDARGIKTSYDYDSFKRLKSIRDHDGNISKSFIYNLSSKQNEEPAVFYNDEKSQIFTRNNCVIGSQGSEVKYIVPANRYSSTTKADANRKALADISLNGQNYANATGSCIVSQIYARVEIKNIKYGGDANLGENYVTGDVFVCLYKDANCTQPFVATSNLSMNIKKIQDKINFDNYSQNTEIIAYTFPINQSFSNIGNMVIQDQKTETSPSTGETYINGVTNTFNMDSSTTSSYIPRPTVSF